MQNNCQFGMIGLGVMGQNLLLNIADHGFAVAGFDTNTQKVAELQRNATAGTQIFATDNLSQFINALQSPKKIMLLVPAGPAVDAVLQNLAPYLNQGDIVIDGGNSFYKHTNERVQRLASQGIHFMGMGVSGGEEGARRGPALMPGGDEVAWHHVQPIFEAIAAKVGTDACVAYMGKDAAGHFVKMVHNGIEYAVMQLIAETYAVLKHGLHYTNTQLQNVFTRWNSTELESYLIEITADIFGKKADDGTTDIIDIILDVAGSKGTGKWTSVEALQLGIPIPTIDAAVTARAVSTFKPLRNSLATTVQKSTGEFTVTENDCKSALYAAIIVAYVQGLHLIQQASVDMNMQVPLANAVKVWRGGCIIRSQLLTTFYDVFVQHPQTVQLLEAAPIQQLLSTHIQGLRAVVSQATQNGIACSALASAVTYFDMFSTAYLPINLIQAQRDYFGAHTYQRTDKDGSFHTQWQA
jgi:6-phosphogluconate dehydrogenase